MVCRRMSDRKIKMRMGAGYRLLAWVNCCNLWKEQTDVRDFIIHSQLSSACSAVPGTAPPGRARHAMELHGIGGD